jgi:hypothetical protein
VGRRMGKVGQLGGRRELLRSRINSDNNIILYISKQPEARILKVFVIKT